LTAAAAIPVLVPPGPVLPSAAVQRGPLSESDKLALVQDETTPFFTSPHYDGHLSVLVRASRIGELTLQELTEVVQDLAEPRVAASRRRVAQRRRGRPASVGRRNRAWPSCVTQAWGMRAGRAA
jgi:hypothetical protein